MHEAGQALLVEHLDPAVASACALVVGCVGVGAVIDGVTAPDAEVETADG